ncbi:MAG: carboxymuconolactone decarboxylase family protein [Solirubrobacterales bacterium]|nr:carboxymuconolactone decarboxylase family protein [Solirubrobacterales bacterium]
MARIPYAAPEPLQQMLRRTPFPDDTSGNVFRILARAPSVGAGALNLIYAVLTETELDPRLREIVILRVAQRSGAAYAFAQHAAIAASVGVAPAQVSALKQGRLPGHAFSRAERMALAFADEAVDAPTVSEETFVQLGEHFPPRQILELLLTAGCFRMMCRLVTVLDLEQEPAFGVDTLRRAREPALER